jgi:hypothetical protein
MLPNSLYEIAGKNDACRRKNSVPRETQGRRQRLEGAKRPSIRPAGFEPATDGLEIRCSIQLSYGRNSLQPARRCCPPAGVLHPVELRPAGLEPATCGLGNRRSIHLSYERDVLTTLILSHGTVCCQRVCDFLPRKRVSESGRISSKMPLCVVRKHVRIGAGLGRRFPRSLN